MPSKQIAHLFFAEAAVCTAHIEGHAAGVAGGKGFKNGARCQVAATRARCLRSLRPLLLPCTCPRPSSRVPSHVSKSPYPFPAAARHLPQGCKFAARTVAHSPPQATRRASPRTHNDGLRASTSHRILGEPCATTTPAQGDHSRFAHTIPVTASSRLAWGWIRQPAGSTQQAGRNTVDYPI